MGQEAVIAKLPGDDSVAPASGAESAKEQGGDRKELTVRADREVTPGKGRDQTEPEFTVNLKAAPRRPRKTLGTLGRSTLL